MARRKDINIFDAPQYSQMESKLKKWVCEMSNASGQIRELFRNLEKEQVLFQIYWV